ncbi:DNA primase [Candidatus Berkelbacteria bacterium]|nr:DNA primase [Candidatus Berkelbacteria bacterium]
MADDQVQEIKDRIDIVDLVNQYVPLRRSGANHKGLCPFHKEKSPSFMVNPERQIFKCFGCDESGDALTFVQKMEGLTFPEALELLADRAGITLDRKKAPEQYRQEKDEKSALYRVNATVAKFCHAVLVKHAVAAGARAYLESRKVSPATIDAFQLGYAPANSSVLAQWLGKQGISASTLRAAGSPERFRNRIMFPIRDPLGNVVGFTGRLLPPTHPPSPPASASVGVGPEGPKYYNTPETAIFKKSRAVYGLYEAKQSLKHHKAAVLVEGQMDVTLSHQVGLTVAVASSGTALTVDHLATLKRYVPKVLIAFDADAAGLAATKKAIQLAIDADLAAKVVRFPVGIKDAGEAIERDPSLWKDAVAKAQPALDWLIQTAVAEAGEPLDGAGKKQVARATLPFIARIADPVERAHHLSALAVTLRVPEPALREALDRAKVRSPARAGQPVTGAPAASRPRAARSLAEQLVGLVLLQPSIGPELKLTTDHVASSPRAQELLTAYQACYSAEVRQSPAEFFTSLKATLPSSLKAEADLLLAEVESLAPDREAALQVARELRGRLQRASREGLKDTIASEIAAAEAAGDRPAVKKLMGQLQEMLKG